jgi:hypothetical protein
MLISPTLLLLVLEQDRQRTYNVTSKGVLATIVVVEKQ